MAVPYDYYRIFYYAAKYQSFTRAAKILGSSQPNLTRTMNALEGQLGCRLFQRSHKGIALTPEGERLFTHVSVAQEQLVAGEAELSREQGLQSGTLSIGASETALHCLLLPVLRQFRRLYPGVRVCIANHSTPQAVTALRDGTVELAVVTTPTGIQKPLKEEALVLFQDILIGGPDTEMLAKRPVPLAALAGRPLVCLGRQTKTFEFLDCFFSEHGLVLQPDVEAATTDQILPLVKGELGLGFLPRSFAAEALARGEVYEIHLAEVLPPRQVCLVWDKSRPMSCAARELCRLLRAESRKQG